MDSSNLIWRPGMRASAPACFNVQLDPQRNVAYFLAVKAHRRRLEVDGQLTGSLGR